MRKFIQIVEAMETDCPPVATTTQDLIAMREITESASLDVTMHRQVSDACRTVMDYIYRGNEPYAEVTFGDMGEFYVFLSRTMGLEDDFLLAIGVRNPHAIGMSGALSNFSRSVFGYDRGIFIHGMRRFTTEDMRATINSTSFIEVFQHEFLHLLDIHRTSGRITARNRIDAHNHAQYYNDPAEFNAYLHDAARPMLDVIQAAKTTPHDARDYMSLFGLSGDPRDDIAQLLTRNMLLRRFVKSLTPNRRRSLLRRLYLLHQRMTEVVASTG